LHKTVAKKMKERAYSNNINKNYAKILIEVEDSGVGMKPESLPKLFMDFARLDEHSKINAQGTGLGLSICKRMIEQMGGKVGVKSELGKGTLFEIELKVKIQAPEEEEAKVAVEEEEKNNGDVVGSPQ
jgi:signal transduction histidine kinase